MAKSKKSTKKSCAGLTAKGKLKKGYKYKKGSACPVKARKKARRARRK